MVSPTPPFPSPLEFGSFLVYPTRRGQSQAEDNARSFLIAIKQQKISPTSNAPFIQLLAQRLKTALPGSVLAGMFDGAATLVPAPSSGLTKKNTVWAPRSICDAFVREGLAQRTLVCVERFTAVKKSAWCGPGERPTPLAHYESMRVVPMLEPPENIVIVDDVITKGATFLGVAARLREACPYARIRAFGVARTEFAMKNWIDPTVGEITLDLWQQARRQP
jgi:predicted amidophosphoribosyltransferase